MKAHWGSGSIVPRVLDLGNRWGWVVSFTPRPLYRQEKGPWYPLHRRLGGPQSRCGRGRKVKNSQPLPGLEPPTIQPVAQRYQYKQTFWEKWNPWETQSNVSEYTAKCLKYFRTSWAIYCQMLRVVSNSSHLTSYNLCCWESAIK
jgi:hypothetical protein